LLLAMLYALTHHARYNEITALRAAGVSLWRLCAPYFIVGLAMSGIYFLLNEIAVPRASQWAEAIKLRHVKPDRDSKAKSRFVKIGFRNAGRFWQIGEYDAATDTMFHPNVTWSLPDGSLRQVWAERGVHTNGIWVLLEATLFTQASPTNRPTPWYNTNAFAMPEFGKTPAQLLTIIKFNDTQGLLASRSADIPLSELWPYLQENPELSGKAAAGLLTKFHGRIAAPWTCLVVVLIAIPFGAASGRRNLFVGVAGSIFIGFAFFVLHSVGMALGEGGHLPGWLAAWLANLCFATLGTVLIMRTR
jgi:lipopolysaccharide export system permease protein